MENKAIAIAYLGIDNFDYILYLSRIFYKLGKKVLLVDRSDTRSLSRALPIPLGIDVNKEVISYRRVDFTAQEINTDMIKQYDIILAAYGFNDIGNEAKIYNRFVLVTDLYLHNLERINKLNVTFPESSERYLLIRNVVDTKLTPYNVSNKVEIEIPAENQLFIYFEYSDYTSAIICQSNQVARFTRISNSYKQLLIEDVNSVYPDLPRSVCAKAFKKAKKGD